MRVSDNGHCFDVRWPLCVRHKTAGHIMCKTVEVNAGGILFVSPERYCRDELVDMAVWIDLCSLVCCRVRILEEEYAPAGQYAYRGEFMRFFGQGRKEFDREILSLLHLDDDCHCVVEDRYNVTG